MASQCQFCGSSAAHTPDRKFSYTECPVCGKYFYPARLPPTSFLESQPETKRDHWRLNCIHENIEFSNPKIRLLWLTKGKPSFAPDEVVDYQTRNYEDYVDIPIIHADKPDDFLETIALELNHQNPSSLVALTQKHLFRCKILDEAEAYLWIRPLVEEEYLETHEKVSGGGTRLRKFEDHPFVSTEPNSLARPQTLLRLTAKGWGRARRIHENLGARQAFVAISFSHAERNQIEGAIREACKTAGGYEAHAVDRKEYLGSIPDRILAEINRSRFVVADFTEFDDAAKQHTRNAGVHFEVGYAEGRGIPVIMTVQRNALKTCVHFDLKHKNLIVWKSLDDLKQKLTDCIDAIINR